ncbi:hypothetical protein K439DRAFT_1635826 [Ramaria rubella]|nr:hypothetical protein K439DRAFT_1635826 [Ramaria rubella]
MRDLTVDVSKTPPMARFRLELPFPASPPLPLPDTAAYPSRNSLGSSCTTWPTPSPA